MIRNDTLLHSRANENSSYISEMKGVNSWVVTKNRCFVLTYLILFASCHKATPAGFWLDFRKDLIVKSFSDQGPYGGKRGIFWKSNSNRTFDPFELIEFARKNGWQLTDSIFIPFVTSKKWVNDSFPFTYSQFSDSTVVNVGFPIWIKSDVVVYRFITGWVAIEPGNARQNKKNGYIVFNPNGSEIAIYQLWGE